MKYSWIADKILEEIGSILDQVDDGEVENIIDLLLQAKRIFISGMGRSGLVARSFAMRLMHLGLKTFVVGDVITPAIGESDLLIVISGSGETYISRHIAGKSKGLNAIILLITSKKDTSLAQISDHVLILPDIKEPILPLKSAFEASAYILLDAVVIMIMDKTGITFVEMMKRHSNLE